MKPFLTDDELANRLRDLERKLRDRGHVDLAGQVADLIWILASEERIA